MFFMDELSYLIFCIMLMIMYPFHGSRIPPAFRFVNHFFNLFYLFFCIALDISRQHILHTTVDVTAHLFRGQLPISFFHCGQNAFMFFR